MSWIFFQIIIFIVRVENKTKTDISLIFYDHGAQNHVRPAKQDRKAKVTNEI